MTSSNANSIAREIDRMLPEWQAEIVSHGAMWSRPEETALHVLRIMKYGPALITSSKWEHFEEDSQLHHVTYQALAIRVEKYIIQQVPFMFRDQVATVREAILSQLLELHCRFYEIGLD